MKLVLTIAISLYGTMFTMATFGHIGAIFLIVPWIFYYASFKNKEKLPSNILLPKIRLCLHNNSCLKKQKRNSTTA